MKYLRKLIWFVVFRLLILCCVLGLVVTSFYYAMNANNIQVVLKDGMAKRARLILTGEDPGDLTDYFYSSYLNRDPEIKNAQQGLNYYLYYYNITGFDHRIELKWVWCWPWEDTATVTMTERVPAIDGKVRSGQRESARTQGLTDAPPAWQNLEYNVVMMRENDRWRVRNMTATKVLDGD